MKVVTVVGARPQFIKCAPVSRELRKVAREVLVHTGQHYDDNMSAVFFRELDIPTPDYNLMVGAGPHGAQTGEMLARIEVTLLKERPDAVVVYGDTNSTLAGALAAVKLHVPVAHVEAGVRSFNRRMPEETNRVLTDHLSTWCFCPTGRAVQNLNREGITEGVHLTGDVMQDAMLENLSLAEGRSTILQDLKLEPRSYFLVTVHRADNTDDPVRLGGIAQALVQLGEVRTVLWPVHPRTRRAIEGQALRGVGLSQIRTIEPVAYFDMLMLERNAAAILTDSGGIQKEAYWLHVPCVTLREETEWMETVESGWNVLVGVDAARIATAACQARPGTPVGGTGTTPSASQVVKILVDQRYPARGFNDAD